MDVPVNNEDLFTVRGSIHDIVSMVVRKATGFMSCEVSREVRWGADRHS